MTTHFDNTVSAIFLLITTNRDETTWDSWLLPLPAIPQITLSSVKLYIRLLLLSLNNLAYSVLP